MAQTMMRIGVLNAEARQAWKDLDDVLVDYTRAEVFEIVNRYMDQQGHAINYRVKRNATMKIRNARLAELEAKLASGQLQAVEVEEEE
jgi:hypothetical protein